MTPLHGVNDTFLENVTLFRASEYVPKMPLIYDQCICIAAQGRKTCHLSDRVFTYGPEHYLVVPTIVPVEIEIFADEQSPLLGITLPLNYEVVLELMESVAASKSDGPALPGSTPGVYLEPLGDNILDPALRLLNALKSEADARILGPQIIREIYYRTLMGENGHILASAARGESAYARIAKALRTIHDNYQTPMDVARLASEANMSPRSFHDHFKSVTSHTPVQYLKRIRLEKARLFLVNQKEQASAAAHMVGYESPSQFSREFKRHFGYPPREAIAREQALN